MSLGCQGCSSAPAPLGEAPWVIPALLQSVVSMLVGRVGDISKQGLLALFSPLSAGLEAPQWPWGAGSEGGQARGE